MKRVRRISLIDGDRQIKVTIEARAFGLTRWEINDSVESLTEKIIIAVADSRRLGGYISQVKVK